MSDISKRNKKEEQTYTHRLEKKEHTKINGEEKDKIKDVKGKSEERGGWRMLPRQK